MDRRAFMQWLGSGRWTLVWDTLLAQLHQHVEAVSKGDRRDGTVIRWCDGSVCMKEARVRHLLMTLAALRPCLAEFPQLG